VADGEELWRGWFGQVKNEASGRRALWKHEEAVEEKILNGLFFLSFQMILLTMGIQDQASQKFMSHIDPLDGRSQP